MDALPFLLAVVTTTLIGAFTFIVVYLLYVHRKYSHIPGPKRASFFQGNFPQLVDAAVRGRPSSELLLDWAKTYGRTYLVWFYHEPMVVTAAPEAVKELLVTGQHPKSRRKYEQVINLYGQRFAGRSIAAEWVTRIWSPRRTAFNPKFSHNSCKGMMDAMNTVANDMVEYLLTKADGKTPIQLGFVFNRVALDIITQAAYGKDYRSIWGEKCVLSTAIRDSMAGLDMMLKDFVLGSWKFWDNAAAKEKARSACKTLRGTIGAWLDERIETIEKREYVPDDIITAAINASEISSQGKETAIDDLIAFYIAGQETTASTLGFAMLELGKHPDILEELQKEVDRVLGTKGNINHDDLTELTTTARVLQETLRKYPVFPFHCRDVATENFVTDGFKIPKGTMINVNSYISQNLPEHFDDPGAFNPDRFKSESSYSPYNYYPFLIGPRNCIGQAFAKIEAKLVIAKFLQRFDYTIHPSQRYGFEERTTLTPLDGVMVTITERIYQGASV